MSEPPANPSGLRCRAEIDGPALRANAAAVAAMAGGHDRIIAVVKADAYGHGLDPVCRVLAGRVGAFAVANADEAAAVERAAHSQGVRDPVIYLLSPALPEEVPAIAARGWIPAISTLEECARFRAAAARADRRLAVHVVVDTGMGRIGTLPEAADAVIAAVHGAPELVLESVASHHPSADEDAAFTTAQAATFREMIERWQARHGPFAVHLGNSAGLSGYRNPAGEKFRVGLLLYGVSPLPDFQSCVRPVLRWTTRVGLVRKLPAGHGISYGRAFITPHPMTVATLTAGYGDGYPRHASGRGAQVLIHGRRCPVLGRITMDQIMVDVSALPAPVHPGDEAVLLGSDGTESITAHELADRAGTIPWHLFTGITARTARILRDP